MYTIGQISQMFNIPVSTLRYYDKEGLFPGLERRGNVRKFSDREIETLRVIECLKKSGLEIKEIRNFMSLVEKGSSTYPQRKEIFEKQKETIAHEIEKLNEVLDMLKFKCWYYDKAMEYGSEEPLRNMLPDKLPPEIQPLYDNAHK